MQDSARFEIVGPMTRKWVAASGKVAKITVETSVNGRRAKHEIRTFDGDTIRAINDIGEGEVVTVRGIVSSEALTDRKGNKVESNGYQVWGAMLNANSVQSANSGQRKQYHQNQKQETPPNDDDIPW